MISVSKIFIAACVWVIAIGPFAGLAETIFLHNGTSVSGEMIEQTKKSVKMKFQGIPITYYRNQIKGMELALNPMMDFDYMTRSTIYSLRQKKVYQYPMLLTGKYTVSNVVFGQIQDKKAWWGIMGLSYYGPGKQSIAGVSEEARFILNPFLLVALGEVNAFVVTGKPKPATGIYPKPIKLEWNLDGAFAEVTYNVKEYWMRAKRYYDEKYLYDFELVAYNARDFGFNYLSVLPEKSKNVIYKPGVVPIQQFIHCGGSCGYQGGCNNHSPHQPMLEIKVQRLPAKLHLNLWRNKPKGSKRADMVFVIQMR
jgi:hypothetical protein